MTLFLRLPDIKVFMFVLNRADIMPCSLICKYANQGARSRFLPANVQKNAGSLLIYSNKYNSYFV